MRGGALSEAGGTRTIVYKGEKTGKRCEKRPGVPNKRER